MPELNKLTKKLNFARTGQPTSKELDAATESVRKDYPELFEDLRTPQLFEDPFRRSSYSEVGGIDQARQNLILARASHARTVFGLKAFEKELKNQGRLTTGMWDKINEAKQALARHEPAGIDEFDVAALEPTDDLVKELSKLRINALKNVYNGYYQLGNQSVREARNAMYNWTTEAYKSVPFGEHLVDNQHMMNRGNKQQLGFTRFVEFEPGEKIYAPGRPTNEPVYDFPLSKKGVIFATELQSDMRKALAEKKREIETPFDLNNRQALIDLMIKNMVDVAIKRNRDLVLFPSTDSNQPQLYENIHKYVTTTVKDLGPNFEAVKVPMTNSAGQRVIRSGIYITPEGEKEILEKGLKFAKGGMVDKPLYDRAA